MGHGRCIVRIWDVERGEIMRTISDATEADIEEVEEDHALDPGIAIEYVEVD